MRKINFLLSVAFLLCLSSCATTISTQVMRPAELDLNGAKTMAVLPFQPNPWNNKALDVLDYFFSPANENIDKRMICDEITENLTMSFLDSNYMKMISASAVQNALKSGKTPSCDVYLTGYIRYYDEQIDRLERKRDDKIIISYRKTVDISIAYEIIDAKTNTILSHRYKDFTRYSSDERKKADLPSGYKLIKYDLSSLVNEIKRQIQPYSVTVSFSLLEDKTKDPQIQSAHELAKSRNLEAAEKLFLEAYDRTGNFECAYNAAIILEALQEYDKAEEMMLDLYNKTYDMRTKKALNDIRTERSYAQKLNAQRNARKN